MTIWNVLTGNESRSWDVTSVTRVSAFHPHGKILAGGNEDGSIVLWDTTTGQKIRDLAGHSARVRALKFTPNGKALVSSGDDGTIRLWNPEQSRVKDIVPIGPANRPLTFDLDPSGKYLFAAGQFPVIFILRLPEGDKAKAALDPDRAAAEYVLSVGGFVRINDESRDIRAVADLPKVAFRLKLAHLEFANRKPTDTDLASFEGCKHLTFIQLRSGEVGDAGLIHLKDCKRLTNLELYFTKVTDEGLAAFAGCKELSVLILNGCMRVSDDGMKHFTACKELIKLEIPGTKVTQAGLDLFKGCKKLKEIRK